MVCLASIIPIKRLQEFFYTHNWNTNDSIGDDRHPPVHAGGSSLHGVPTLAPKRRIGKLKIAQIFQKMGTPLSQDAIKNGLSQK